MTAPERQFATFRRGVLRDEMLASFRYSIRQLTNPETGTAFTETEIATATARLSRYYNEADAIDLVLLTSQNRALYLADQVRVDRAAHAFLESFHGLEQNLPPLPASGGSGPVSAPATVGTIFVGSTTVPDPAAHYGTTPAGLRFQVLFTVVTGATGIAALQCQGVDLGTDSNIAVGTEITWANGPVGAPSPGAVTTKFSGGLGTETDGDYARRILATMRDKEGSGNNAQFRRWSRESSVAVEDAFIYATALHAGSVRIAITQKRGSTLGPTARIASVGTLTEVIAKLTPPGSPLVPTPPFILVTASAGEVVDMSMAAALPFGQLSGYDDLSPWPTIGSATPFHSEITGFISQIDFTLTRGLGSDDLPSTGTPSLMLWDALTSRWESLDVASITALGGDTFRVVLSSAPTTTIANGQYVSPDVSTRLTIAQAIDAYFDHLGPSELIDLTTDPRAHRAYRFPRTNEEFPQRAGSGIESWIRDAIGTALVDFSMAEQSLLVPTVPASPVTEPNLLVAGRMGIYSF